MVSGTDNEGLPAISPMVQNFGKRLKRVFSGPTPPPAESASQQELDQVIFIAAGAESRAKSSTDYRNTSERITADLRAAKVELEEAAVRFKSTRKKTSRNVEKEQDIVLFTLARINTALGNYDEAESNYLAIYAGIPLDVGSTYSVTRTLEAYQVEVLLAYLEFNAVMWRNLERAESLGTVLLSPNFQDTSWTTDEECRIRLALIQVYNAKGNYAAATAETLVIEGLEGLDKSVFLHIQTSIAFYLERAITSIGLGDDLRARRDFVIALVRSATVLGLWHGKTRGVLFNFGKALREWGYNEAASKVLGECCLGDYHQLGKDHPLSKHRYSELERYPSHIKILVSEVSVFQASISAPSKQVVASCLKEATKCSNPMRLLIFHSPGCKGAQPQLDYLRRFKDTTYEDETQLSVAYEHIYLNTVIDLLVSAGESLFNEVENTLQALIDYKTSLKVETAEHGAIYIHRIHRALASCKFVQGKREEAIRSVVEIDTGFIRSAEGTLQSNLDLVMFYSDDSSTKAKAIELSRSVFFDADIKLNHDQAAAFHRRLSALNATHFTYESIVNNALPLKILENVGTGAYAVVESVEIGARLYARKSISLPRYSQNRIRQTIQNEISVIRALSNPHIVKVYCTYEEKSRFSIILQPLADCDLEAYLEQHTYADNPDSYVSHQKLLWKWLGCLANTLAFIHSKGIRHKDIKTRNVLVKDSEVIFADFGSSHAFLDEGTSVTEGPAFGHTLMYCAPEVVSWANRGRSADIFSLGCVFTEIATSLDDRSISDYYEFRSKEIEDQGRETHAYHATLNLVHSWFTQEQVSSEVLLLYLDVMEPMLNMDPMLRPTAKDASEEISTVFRYSFGTALTTCSKCSQEPWEGTGPWSDADLSGTDQQHSGKEKQKPNHERDPKLAEELVEFTRHIRSSQNENGNDGNSTSNSNTSIVNHNDSSLDSKDHAVDQNNEIVHHKQTRPKEFRHRPLSQSPEASERPTRHDMKVKHPEPQKAGILLASRSRRSRSRERKVAQPFMRWTVGI